MTAEEIYNEEIAKIIPNHNDFDINSIKITSDLAKAVVKNTAERYHQMKLSQSNKDKIYSEEDMKSAIIFGSVFMNTIKHHPSEIDMNLYIKEYPIKQ